ncbi:MAG: hypothetical protein HQ582_13405 [Planctomycetes bacterium]|nr:hypothetical protein [Planctomycetota bacterium]
MRIESDLPSFIAWFPLALLYWVVAIVTLAVVAKLLGYFIAAVEYGPVEGARRTKRTILAGMADLVMMSPRRVGALAWLAVKESIRRRVVVAFAVFILVLLFAGWCLDPGSPNPSRLYLSFVLTATSYLVLLLALFLSAFSLPTDVRTKTLHTVVTKPVRPSEIVLGRMLGFTIIGTGLLLIMAVVSYFFVVQGLSHSHSVAAEDLRSAGQAAGGASGAPAGKTSNTHGHRHEVFFDASGKAYAEVAQGHWHDVTTTGSGAGASHQLSSPRGMLVARVPRYGKIRFRDRDGLDTDSGINVGDEWAYRGYIQGASPAAMIWSFDGVREKAFDEGFPVEMTLGVFRTHKGNIERGVLGSIAVRNPKTGLSVEVEIFESKEFATRKLVIPRKITKFASKQVIPRQVVTPTGVQLIPEQIDPGLAERREFDLFEDLVADGEVEIWVRCLEPGQYFGAAQADLYLRAADAAFALNFVKGYFGIWLQMVLVIGFGVMFSTFLSGSVAMIATLGTLVGGFFSEFMGQLALGRVEGGGPLEALTRLLLQENLSSELSGPWTVVMLMADRVLQVFLWVIASILPSFSRFSYSEYVAYGFNISGELILIRTLNAFAYLVPVFVAAYFFLKTREVAR